MVTSPGAVLGPPWTAPRRCRPRRCRSIGPGAAGRPPGCGRRPGPSRCRRRTPTSRWGPPGGRRPARPTGRPGPGDAGARRVAEGDHRERPVVAGAQRRRGHRLVGERPDGLRAPDLRRPGLRVAALDERPRQPGARHRRALRRGGVGAVEGDEREHRVAGRRGGERGRREGALRVPDHELVDPDRGRRRRAVVDRHADAGGRARVAGRVGGLGGDRVRSGAGRARVPRGLERRRGDRARRGLAVDLELHARHADVVGRRGAERDDAAHRRRRPRGR